MAARTGPVRTQVERTAAMRRRLLDATVACLADRGYAATTTLAVQERAGVSRGALLHHFGSRSELLLAAVDHVARERMAAVLAATVGAPPDDDRLGWAVRVLWSTFEGPLFGASLELWLAARNDADLLAALLPQERVIGRAIQAMAGDLFGEQVRSAPGFAVALELLLDAMRGAAARSALRGEGSDVRLAASWRVLVERLAAGG